MVGFGLLPTPYICLTLRKKKENHSEVIIGMVFCVLKNTYLQSDTKKLHFVVKNLYINLFNNKKGCIFVV